MMLTTPANVFRAFSGGPKDRRRSLSAWIIAGRHGTYNISDLAGFASRVFLIFLIFFFLSLFRTEDDYVSWFRLLLRLRDVTPTTHRPFWNASDAFQRTPSAVTRAGCVFTWSDWLTRENVRFFTTARKTDDFFSLKIYNLRMADDHSSDGVGNSSIIGLGTPQARRRGNAEGTNSREFRNGWISIDIVLIYCFLMYFQVRTKPCGGKTIVSKLPVAISACKMVLFQQQKSPFYLTPRRPTYRTRSVSKHVHSYIYNTFSLWTVSVTGNIWTIFRKLFLRHRPLTLSVHQRAAERDRLL